eukprot:6466009-Amphidinium_carterae.1
MVPQLVQLQETKRQVTLRLPAKLLPGVLNMSSTVLVRDRCVRGCFSLESPPSRSVALPLWCHAIGKVVCPGSR